MIDDRGTPPQNEPNVLQFPTAAFADPASSTPRLFEVDADQPSIFGVKAEPVTPVLPSVASVPVAAPAGPQPGIESAALLAINKQILDGMVLKFSDDPLRAGIVSDFVRAHQTDPSLATSPLTDLFTEFMRARGLDADQVEAAQPVAAYAKAQFKALTKKALGEPDDEPQDQEPPQQMGLLSSFLNGISYSAGRGLNQVGRAPSQLMEAWRKAKSGADWQTQLDGFEPAMADVEQNVRTLKALSPDAPAPQQKLAFDDLVDSVDRAKSAIGDVDRRQSLAFRAHDEGMTDDEIEAIVHAKTERLSAALEGAKAFEVAKADPRKLEQLEEMKKAIAEMAAAITEAIKQLIAKLSRSGPRNANASAPSPAMA